MLGCSREGGIRSAPAYTITGRARHKLPQNTQFPGPGSYDGNFEAVVRRQPVFSMATRFKIPTDENMKPGAGTYRPEKVSIELISP